MTHMSETKLVTEQLASWLCGHSYDQLPVPVRAKATEVIFDSVGAMAACSILPEVKAIVALLKQQGGKEDCTVIGHPLVTSVINAAMANGGMAHGNEVDPVHTTSVGGHV